jgi:sugar phosphate permease
MNDRFESPREMAGEFRGRAIWVALGCFICQMGLGLTYIRTGLAPELIEGLNLTRTQLSGAAFPQLVFQALAGPLVGFLSVRLGASRVLAVSATLFSFVFLFFSRVESLSGLYIAIAGVGLCAAGMGDITVGHVVSQWFRKNRGLALGIAYAGSNLGGMLMVAIVSTVTLRHSWREGLLTVVPIALFVLLPAALFLVRNPPRGYHARMVGTSAEAEDESSHEPDDLDLKSAVRTRSFWILTTTLFTFFFYFTGILDHFVLFLTDTGMSKADARFYFGQAIGLGVVSKVLGGFLSDRIPQFRAIQAVYALLGFSSLVLLFLPSPALLWVFIVSYGFSQACRDVVYPLVLGRCFGDRHLGEIYGAMTLTLLPGGALGPIFAAVLRDRLGHYDVVFGVFAVLNVLALGGLFLLRDERRVARPAELA